MTKTIKHILAIAMAVLMLAATFGTVAVSATVIKDNPYDRTVYFVNNKNWDDAYAYTWADGKTPKTPFPGEAMEKVGTIKAHEIWLGIPEGEYEVYKIELTDGDDNTIFAQGGDHGQQSKPLYTRLPYAGVEFYGLDQNNYAVELNLTEDMIKPLA